MLAVDGIDVFYGDLQVIWGLSLQVGKGEIVGIVGSNGAGKTTILRAISGLLPPKKGSISFLGEKIDELPPFRIVELGLSHIPQGRRLFPLMSVLKNLEMGAYTEEAAKKKEETLDLVFELFPILKERIKQLASTLSGGEQQMLAIARGLMSRPKLLMLDEPSAGLAPMVARRVFDAVTEINKMGTTILLVEQNVLYTLKLADRAYVLETGRIVLEGEGRNLLNNEFVKKAYLGI